MRFHVKAAQFYFSFEKNFIASIMQVSWHNITTSYKAIDHVCTGTEIRRFGDCLYLHH
jgi:hypothetical protein